MAKKRKKFLIPNSIGTAEFNDLFREWRRERYSSICVWCARWSDCSANILCFKRTIEDFLMWIKSKQRGELRGYGKKA